MAAAAPPGSGGPGSGGIDLGLQGSAIVVTGGGSGIGAAAARLLAASGAAVVLARRPGLLRQTADAIGLAGGRALCVAADLADPACPALIIEAALGEFGRVDGVVNNAAVCRHFPLAGWQVAGFDEHWATNVRAPFFLIPGVVVHDRSSDPAGRRPGDPPCLRPPASARSQV